ncbi:hypothetical protein CTEN210_13922 [Chaetoceros tenuissimus]|uniref:G2/mitotic-specific cyclin-B3 n=1 Tax=Chaetoceros tenuissimus TaxID=426638 RepID=A0AAD3D400_9STRA|nr:hypothetical protein CTEN210_13922 [Chaetoceros tenuissimus]
MPRTRAQLKRLGTENTKCIASHSSHTSHDSKHAKRKSSKKTTNTKTKSTHVKRKSSTFTQGAERRTTRSKQPEINTQEHVSKKQKRNSLITPSPVPLPAPKKKLVQSCDNVATDLQFESVAQRTRSKIDNSSSSSSSRFSSEDTASIATSKSQLPPGVKSIVCPFISKCQQRKPCSSSVNGSCGCPFNYNHNSSHMLTESYLSSYSSEYIASLYEKELDLEFVRENFFPLHLRNTTEEDSESQQPSAKIRRRSPRLLEAKKQSGEDSEATIEIDFALRPVKNFTTFYKSDTSEMNSESSISNLSESVDETSSGFSFNRKRFDYYMNYLSRQKKGEGRDVMTAQIREVLVDWMIEVSGEYKLSNMTLHTAIGLVDRCLANENFEMVRNSVHDIWDEDSSCSNSSSSSSSKESGRTLCIDRRSVQLLGCTCMMIASKMHDENYPDLGDFVYISASQYRASEFIQMEMDICSLLSFKLHLITPQHFANIFVRASYVSGNGLHRPVCSMGDADKSETQGTFVHLVNYFLELATMNPIFLCRPPSLIAATAVYLARATLDIKDVGESEESFFSKTLEHYSGYSTNDLLDSVLDLHEQSIDIKSHENNAVYEKYKSDKYNKVSQILPADKRILSPPFSPF